MNDTTWLTTAQDGLEWESMECDFVSDRLKQPTRPTTPIATTAPTKPTATGQATHMTEAHDDNDAEGFEDVPKSDPQNDQSNRK